MKKIMQVVFVLVASICFISTASAETNSKLLEYAKASHKIAGESVTLTDSDIVKIERFLNENTVTDDQADQIIAKADEIIAILDKEGVTDYTKLSKDKKNEVFDLAKQAAAIVNVTLSYNNSDKEVVAYDKNGKKIDVISISPYLKQTGSDNTVMYASLSGIAVIGIASVAYRKKRNA